MVINGPIMFDIEVIKDLGPHHAEMMIPHRRVRGRVSEMAREWKGHQSEIAETESVIFMTVLSGGAPFAEMFLDELAKLPGSEEYQKDNVRVGSYGLEMSSNNMPEITCIPKNIEAIKGARIVLLEDIKDTGRSLKLLVEYFRALGASSVEIIALLAKSEMQEVEPEADSTMIGFEIPSDFVVGEGIDWAEKYRIKRGIWKIVEHNDGVTRDNRRWYVKLWEKVNVWVDRHLT